MTNENIQTDIARITHESAGRSEIEREKESVAVKRMGRERPKRPEGRSPKGGRSILSLAPFDVGRP